MKNLKLRKILLTICSAMLLVTLSVGATFAYLTSQDSVTNTFTVGNVKITLDEAKVDDKGQAIENADRVTENTYKLFPGGTYDKDPTIHIDSKSEEAYLGVKVVFEGGVNADALGLPMLEIFQKIDTTAWTIGEKQIKDKNVEYLLIYNTTIKGGTNDIKLFEKMVIPSTLTNEQIGLLDNVEMGITAYAVQADGFTSADEALNAGFSTVFPKPAAE